MACIQRRSWPSAILPSLAPNATCATHRRALRGALRGHMHNSTIFNPPEAEGARRARRRSVIDCLEAIVREGNLNSRTTPQGSPPEAVRSPHP